MCDGERLHQPSMRPKYIGHDAFMRTPCRVRGLDQEEAQEAVALFGDGAEALLGCRRALLRDEPEITRDLLAAAEARRVTDGDDVGERGHWSYAGLCHQQFCARIVVGGLL